MSNKKDTKKAKDVEDTKKNYIKNYVILVAIFACTIFLTLYLCKWYEVYDDYQKETPIIRGSLQEITSDDLDHYVIDTPSVIVYMCTANDDECRSFEKDFKKYVNKNDVSDVVTYLNLTNVDKEVFLDSFNRKYHYKVKLSGNYPAFVAFEDGNVTSILQGSKTKKLTISKVNSFLELNMMEEEEEVLDTEVQDVE